MATQHATGTKLTDGTEQTLNTTTPETTTGIFQLLVDVSVMLNGDAIELRVKEKAGATGDTQRTLRVYTLANAQGASAAGWVSDPFILLHGWDMTIKRVAGTDRSYVWSIRKA